MGVTWPRLLPNAPVVSYTTVSPLPDSLSFERKIGGMFLWPDPAGNRSAAILLLIAPTPGIIRHRALWSADFPPINCLGSVSAIARPTWYPHHTIFSFASSIEKGDRFLFI
jgi:hypothetical protein